MVLPAVLEFFVELHISKGTYPLTRKGSTTPVFLWLFGTMQRMKEGSVDISMLIKLFSWSRKSEHTVLKLAILALVFDFTTTLFLSLLWPGEAGPPPPWSD